MVTSRSGNTITKEREKLTIIAESDDWIVIDKPAHLLAHPSKPDGARTLWHALRALLAFEIANGGGISIINRLDRETSGLTLVCKNSDAARHFSGLMMQRRIHKEYLALVWGWPERDLIEIDAPLGRRGDFADLAPSPIYLKQCIHPDGAPARTTVRVERRFFKSAQNENACESSNDGLSGRFSLVRAIPHTGRMHQIRVHLAHAGHAVVGDKIYGPDERHYLTFIETGWTPELARELLLPRHALHSAVLRIDEENLAWFSPLPDDLTAFMS